MKTISNAIKFIDIFGAQFNFSLKNKQKIKSVLGGLMTILFIILVLGFLWIFSIDMIYRRNPILLVTDSYSPFTPYITINSNEILFAIDIQTIEGKSIKDIEKYFSIRIFYESKILINNSNFYSVIKNEDLQLVNCMDYIKNFKFYNFNMSTFNELRCIKGINHSIGGYYGDSEIRAIGIKVGYCDNNTNVSCFNIDTIKNFIIGKTINIYHTDYVFDPQNFLAPITTIKKNIWTNLDSQLHKIYEINFQQSKFITDSQLLFVGNDTISTLLFSNLKTDYNPQTNESLDIFEGIIRINSQIKTYRRTYLKIQDILAKISGVINFLIFLFQLIVD